MSPEPAWPATAAARDRFVLERRPPYPRPDPWRPQGVLVEPERDATGVIRSAATVFLTGRECPWRCVMCDLWRHTTHGDTPRGALVRQLHDARRDLAARGVPPDHVKLYNAGSFFDPRAVPESDYEDIALALRGFRHIVVESHPMLVGGRLDRFLEAIGRAGGEHPPTLEVAMGLETANPLALERLHKRFTLDDFARAAARLARSGVALRVFLLVGVPFIAQREQGEWLRRSVDFAFDCGASVVSLIPTRSGNGAMEALERAGAFVRPQLSDLEASQEAALAGARGRVFADLWDVERFADCVACLDARRERLRTINLTQRLVPAVNCPHCADREAVS